MIRLVSRDVSWAACTRQKHTVVARAHLCVPEHFVCKALEGLTLCLSGQVSKHIYVSVHLVRGIEFIGTAQIWDLLNKITRSLWAHVVCLAFLCGSGPKDRYATVMRFVEWASFRADHHDECKANLVPGISLRRVPPHTDEQWFDSLADPSSPMSPFRSGLRLDEKFKALTAWT